jgi:TolB-like protein
LQAGLVFPGEILDFSGKVSHLPGGGMLFRFGDHTLDLERRELHRGLELIPVEPQVFDLLVHLVRNRDRVISKDELIETVWGGRIVSDATIDSRVKAARQAVGDSGVRQRIIRTSPRKGVRFIADVREQNVPAEAGPGSGGIETAPLSLPGKPSLAVLPFQNMSGDPEQEYFADGIVEDIITALSRTGWLFVIARNSSFTYKGQAHDVRQVGRELGVRYVLEGSIRRAGGRVRVTGQLNDAVTGGHIWADRFEGEFGNIFDLQDRLTENVVGAIEPKLRRVEMVRALAKATDKLDAYDLYLRALANFFAHTEPNSSLAVTLLQQALVIDPAYVRAKGVLADIYAQRVSMGWDNQGEREAAATLAREVLATGTDDPDSLGSAGYVLSFCTGDSTTAFAALNRALSLHPNSARTLSLLGYAHVQTVDHPELAVDYFERAMRLSPLDPEIGYMLAGIAMAHNEAKCPERALPHAQRAVVEMPNNAPAHRALIYALVCLDRLEEARAAAAQLLMVQPGWRAASSGWPPPTPGKPRSEYKTSVIRALITAGIPE